MRTRHWKQALAAGTAGLLGGCVDRRFVVETNVPGAQISVDNRQIGPSPADSTYDYTGKYEIKAVAPGYQPLTQVVRLKPKWYDIPPLDFFAEGLWPFRIEDRRVIRLDLEPARRVQADELLGSAEAIREKSKTLPPPSVPDDDGRPGADASNVGGPLAFPPGPPLPPTASIPGATTVPQGTITSPPGSGVVPQATGLGTSAR